MRVCRNRWFGFYIRSTFRVGIRVRRSNVLPPVPPAIIIDSEVGRDALDALGIVEAPPPPREPRVLHYELHMGPFELRIKRW